MSGLSDQGINLITRVKGRGGCVGAGKELMNDLDFMHATMPRLNDQWHSLILYGNHVHPE